MLQSKIGRRGIGSGIPATLMLDLTTSNFSPQPLIEHSSVSQHEAVIFGVTMNESGAWDSMISTGDMQDTWDIDTHMISDMVFTDEWLENNDMSPITPSPPLFSSPHDTLVQQHSRDMNQPPVSDTDVLPTPTGTPKARRQAQNRAAQRAYRARKEEQLERSRLRIIELEQEVRRLQKSSSSRPSQPSGLNNMSVLQDKIATLETRNKTIEAEYQELKEHLQRIAARLLEPHSST